MLPAKEVRKVRPFLLTRFVKLSEKAVRGGHRRFAALPSFQFFNRTFSVFALFFDVFANYVVGFFLFFEGGLFVFQTVFKRIFVGVAGDKSVGHRDDTGRILFRQLFVMGNHNNEAVGRHLF